MFFFTFPLFDCQNYKITKYESVNHVVINGGAIVEFSTDEIEELEYISSDTNEYECNGKPVARVTNIISKMIGEPYLLKWANSLGFKHQSYNAVLSQFAVIGTKVHKGIERLIKGEKFEEDSKFYPVFTGFMNWWNYMNSNYNIEVLGQEHKLVCNLYGGTYDLLLKINGVPWLVDFKTSNHITYKYFLQLSAYSRLLRENEYINIVGCTILQVDKYEPKYTEYLLNISNERDRDYFNMCERTFMSLVYGYYHIKYLENRFENIKWNEKNYKE